MKSTAVFLSLSLQAIAFPFAANEIAAKRQLPTPVNNIAAGLSKARTNCGVIPCTVFSESSQYVSTTGDHAYASPNPNEIRGPCPGLNAAANHGYLSRSGVTTIQESIVGLGAAFGMGPDLAGFLSTYAVIFNGDPVLGTWSIGGPPTTNALTAGLLGQPQGISYAHNNYETDRSIGRCDAYMNNGDAHSLDINRFKQAYETGLEHDRYTLDGLGADLAAKSRECIATNPYCFSGPFAGILVAPAAYNFVVNLMSNHSSEEPSGYLDGETFKTFFAVEGKYPNFKWMPGQERIPDNWYRRTDTNLYGIANADTDVVTQYLAQPDSLLLGGNINGVNTYAGVDLGDLTGGVMNLDELLDLNNPKVACFYGQLVQAVIPDLANTILSDISPITNLVNTHIVSILGNLDCPKIDKFDQTLFNQFPGYKYSPKGKAQNY